jgi:hypothetical protein
MSRIPACPTREEATVRYSRVRVGTMSSSSSISAPICWPPSHGSPQEHGLTIPEHAIYGSMEEGLGDGILLHQVHRPRVCVVGPVEPKPSEEVEVHDSQPAEMERSLHLGPGYQTFPAMDNLCAGPQ